MDAQAIAALGIGGPFILLMAGGMRVLWNAYQAERAQNRADQGAMLPALTESTGVLRQALDEIVRTRALSEREHQ